MGSPRPLGAPQISGSPGYGAAPPRPPSPRAALPPPSPRDAHGAFRLPPHTSMGPPHIPPHILPLGRAVERTSAARFLPSVWGFFQGKGGARLDAAPQMWGERPALWGELGPMGKSCALWGERCPLAVGRRLGEVETKFAWRLLLRGRKCAVGHNGELWGTMRCYGAQWGAVGHNEELWGTVGRCGAQWGAVGHNEELWGTVGRCGALWGQPGPRTPAALWGTAGAHRWHHREVWGWDLGHRSGVWDQGLRFGTRIQDLGPGFGS